MQTDRFLTGATNLCIQITRLTEAHGADVSALAMLGGSSLLASGDESGGFKLWDVRSRAQVSQGVGSAIETAVWFSAVGRSLMGTGEDADAGQG